MVDKKTPVEEALEMADCVERLKYEPSKVAAILALVILAQHIRKIERELEANTPFQVYETLLSGSYLSGDTTHLEQEPETNTPFQEAKKRKVWYESVVEKSDD